MTLHSPRLWRGFFMLWQLSVKQDNRPLSVLSQTLNPIHAILVTH